uniref:Ig-like domain-containing protein n=1 Tax=Oryzias latipes TaxID=8090 RepID=A0A3B3I2V8_ORYLA
MFGFVGVYLHLKKFFVNCGFVFVLDAELTFEPKWSSFFVGESLTFKCDMEEGRTDDWKYTLKKSDWTLYSDVTQQDFKINLLDKSHSGVYQCCGLRKDSDYKKCSNRVSIRVSGNFLVCFRQDSWSQIFRGETITLTCEVQGGEGVQWEYEWRRPQSQTFRTKQKDWTITASISGDYSCKSRPTDDSYSATKWTVFSAANTVCLWMSVYPPKAQISRNGGTLTCSVNPSSSGWSYYFYRGEKNQEVLTVQNTDFHSNREIRVSQGGVYRCRGGRGEPVYSTEISDPVTIVGEFLCVFFLHY